MISMEMENMWNQIYVVMLTMKVENGSAQNAMKQLQQLKKKQMNF